MTQEESNYVHRQVTIFLFFGAMMAFALGIIGTLVLQSTGQASGGRVFIFPAIGFLFLAAAHYVKSKGPRQYPAAPVDAAATTPDNETPTKPIS